MECAIHAGPIRRLRDGDSCAGAQMERGFGMGFASAADRTSLVGLPEPEARKRHAGLARHRINDRFQDGGKRALLCHGENDGGQRFEVHALMISRKIASSVAIFHESRNIANPIDRAFPLLSMI